jgi:hypothetical protein
MTGCGCSKSFNNIVSETILEGEFTRENGVKFKASMSATGGGSTYKIAKKVSKNNVFTTLKNFLETSNPKIVDYKYEIKTK